MGLLISCASGFKSSDHYDGKTFFNPWGVNNKKSFWEVMKWKWSSSAAKWPESVSFDLLVLPSRPSDGVSVTWINHSTFLIQSKDLIILTDPIFSERSSPVSFAGPKRVILPGISFDKIPKVDVVVVSHNHYDHLDLDTLKALEKRDQPLFLVPMGDGAWLKAEGLTQVKELDWWESTKLPGAEFIFTPAQHWSARGLWDRNESLWGGWFVNASGVTLFHAGDTGLGPHFKMIRQRLGTPQVAMLPIGAYEPRWFMKDMHTNPDDAVEAMQILGATFALGMHFATFQLTDEKWDQPPQDLSVALKKRSLDEKMFVAPKPGESFSFRSLSP